MELVSESQVLVALELFQADSMLVVEVKVKVVSNVKALVSEVKAWVSEVQVVAAWESLEGVSMQMVE